MHRADVFEVKLARRHTSAPLLLGRSGETAVIAISAAVLLDQYRTSYGDVLLILDDDTPFEERPTLALLRGDRVIDRAVISRPYQPGIFRAAQVQDDRLLFLFEDDLLWRVSIVHAGFYSCRPTLPGSRRDWRWLANAT